MSQPQAPTDKTALRAELSARRAAMCSHERMTAEAIIRDKLLSLPAWQEARIIGGYMSIRGELDLLPVWQEAVRAKKTYALPVTVGSAREGRMLLRGTPSFCPDALVTGRFGIAEPPDAPAFPTLTPEALDGALILVPGLGFDAEGFRIGYGGGYYDRFLTALSAQGISVTTVGLCPSICRSRRLPREAHDRAVDIVLDEH